MTKKQKCKIKNCCGLSRTRKMCLKHYSFWYRNKSPYKENYTSYRQAYDADPKNIQRKKEFNKTHYKDNKEDYKKRTRTPSTRYGYAKREAKERGIYFNLSKKFYVELTSNPCYYKCDNPLPVYGSGLDRIDNNLGYIKNNVVPCCTSCNKGRHDSFSSDEWSIMIVALKEYRSEKKKT